MVAHFPVTSIGHLRICGERDEASARAVELCTRRWQAAGRQVQVVLPGATATDFWAVSGKPVEMLPSEIVMTRTIHALPITTPSIVSSALTLFAFV